MASPLDNPTSDVGSPRASGTSLSPELEVNDVHKSFGRTRALSGVSLHVDKGEVIGLIGENGAGKSTLLHIISGNIQPDGGSLSLRGREFRPRSPQASTLSGVFHIYQELALVPNLTVYENFFLAHEDYFTTRGFIQRGQMRRKAQEFLGQLGHDWIDPSAKVGSFDFSTRQTIEIAKAFALADLLEITTPVVLLDEPTAGLTHDKVVLFKSLVRTMKQRAAVVFVSHRLSEILELSDRIYVLRDGVVTAEATPDVSERDLHKYMVGRERPELFYQEDRQRPASVQPVLQLRGFSSPGLFHDVSLTVHAGEILGVAGLVGCGKEDLARATFGTIPNVTGELTICSVRVEKPSVRAAMQHGVGYVSPDRRHEGIMPDLSVQANMSIAELTRPGRNRPLINGRREEQETRRFIDLLGIRAAGTKVAVRTLSGGNQQKVLLARWLFCDANLLFILHNPTQGVDAGAKEEIYKLIRSIVDRGCAVLLVTDDLPEVIGLSNRVIVMRDGSVVTEVSAAVETKPNEADLVRYMV